MTTNVDLGFAGFNCTHPLGVVNCPIHKDNPEAPLYDCRYRKPMMTDGKSLWIEYSVTPPEKS